MHQFPHEVGTSKEDLEVIYGNRYGAARHRRRRRHGGLGCPLCLFYETKEDLLDTLISYCRTAELDWNAVSTASGLLRSP
jgi:hypothetical protein